MSQVWTVIWAKLRMARHQIASVRSQSKLKVAVITTAAILLWLGAFITFYAGFDWLVDFGSGGNGEFAFGELLLRQVLSLLALAVFLLLIFSNILVGYGILYRSTEVPYLLHTPLTYRQFFYARFFECVFFSSWSLVFLGSPLMLAYGLSTSASGAFYAAMLLFLTPYAVVPAAIGALISMLLVCLFPRFRTPLVLLLGAVALAAFFLHIYHAMEEVRVAEGLPFQAVLSGMERMQSRFFPSQWAAQGVLAAERHQFGEAGFLWALLVSHALAAVWFSGEFAQRWFYRGWSQLVGQDRQRIKPWRKGMLGKLHILLRVIPNPSRSLCIKDIKLFWRDATQWSQFAIFFGIMAVYVANLRTAGGFQEKEVWRGWVACLNAGAISLILATLTSRFIFPLISLEGHRFWILGLAPLSFRQLVRQKFWLSVCMTSSFTIGLVLISSWRLELEPRFFWLTLYGVVGTNFGLAGLAVGLGALYPNFSEDNPARIVSGMGGTLNLLLSVGYIAVIVTAQVLAFQWRYFVREENPAAGLWLWWIAMGIITAASILFVWAPLRLGLRSLEQSEF